MTFIIRTNTTPLKEISASVILLRPLGISLNDPHRAGGLTANKSDFMILLIIIIGKVYRHSTAMRLLCIVFIRKI